MSLTLPLIGADHSGMRGLTHAGQRRTGRRYIPQTVAPDQTASWC